MIYSQNIRKKIIVLKLNDGHKKSKEEPNDNGNSSSELEFTIFLILG